MDDMATPLDPADVDRFHEGGVLRVPAAFPREVALQIQDTLWRDLERRRGIRRGDPDSWYASDWGGSSAVKSVVARTQTPRLAATLDQLLGAGRWRYPQGWGTLLVGPPAPAGTPWTLTDRAWHWDGLRTVGAWVFCLYCDLEPRAGGTLLVEGSGPLLQRWYDQLPVGVSRRTRSLRNRFLSDHRFLRQLSGRDPVARDPEDLLSPYGGEDGTRLRVTEVTGRAGDVVIAHPNVLHAAPVHAGTTPRFLAIRYVDSVETAGDLAGAGSPDAGLAPADGRPDVGGPR